MLLFMFNQQKPPSSRSDLLTTAMGLPLHTKWAVLMSAGGHFAGAIYDG